MAKITRSNLKKIIQEEIENTIVDEGLLDTFRALGSGLKKFYKDAEVTGEIEASKRATQAAGRQLTDRRDKFRAALSRETDPDRKKRIEQEIDTLDAMIKGLSRGGSEAEEVHAALADVSDGKMEDTDNEFVRAAQRAAATARRIKAEPAEEGETPAEKAAEKKAAAVVKSNPEAYAKIIIAVLNQFTSGRIKKHKDIPYLKDSNPNAEEKFSRALRYILGGKEKAVAEGLAPGTKISRTALQEAIKLMQEYGL